ncbi:liver-expressed antimicrobial peptide 2-like isoform X1 [Oncorhynchus keta]|uniref:liver-expressed antimicrobial peptide 2-like isoform X1 n=1 Tax=Oncorhynchus keta TaxID=8018 RepID=UPI00227BD628|nr:liver-expressed antimicrobial peptide 2-like isoform X1 [Oncorhynchus keta]
MKDCCERNSLVGQQLQHRRGKVQTAPVPEDWTGLITRAKRSLLWRWNTLKPVGTSCREHDECGTKYCRKKICSFQVYIS